jgi:hypothetical protein
MSILCLLLPFSFYPQLTYNQKFPNSVGRSNRARSLAPAIPGVFTQHNLRTPTMFYKIPKYDFLVTAQNNLFQLVARSYVRFVARFVQCPHWPAGLKMNHS